MNTFILGGARSGKSQFAEQLAAQSSKQVVYIATAQARADYVEHPNRAQRSHRVTLRFRSRMFVRNVG